MRITIWFPTGFNVEGVVMSGSDTELRVAIRDWNDVAVFRAQGGDWIAENGDFVLLHPHSSNSPNERRFLELFVIQHSRRDSLAPELPFACLPGSRN